MNLKVKTQEVKTILEGENEGYIFVFEFSATSGSEPKFVSFNVLKEQTTIAQGGYYTDSNQHSFNLHNFSEEDLKIFPILYEKIVELVQAHDTQKQYEVIE
ncbi:MULTISPECIES: hypothetical protein [unclassified Myroides]|uniref:hypothetical protein n=1 Tax=unclassified Myroides TaxID=2642485 RepID=UPI003D2F66CC